MNTWKNRRRMNTTFSAEPFSLRMMQLPERLLWNNKRMEPKPHANREPNAMPVLDRCYTLKTGSR
jgi:hypothetical protein